MNSPSSYTLQDYFCSKINILISTFFIFNKNKRAKGWKKFPLDGGASIMVHFSEGVPQPPLSQKGETQPGAILLSLDESGSYMEKFFCRPGTSEITAMECTSCKKEKEKIHYVFNPEVRELFLCPPPEDSERNHIYRGALPRWLHNIKNMAQSNNLIRFCEGFFGAKDPQARELLREFSFVCSNTRPTGIVDMKNDGEEQVSFSVVLKDGAPDPEGLGFGSPTAVYSRIREDGGQETFFIFLDKSGRVIAFDKNSPDGHEHFTVDPETGESQRCFYNEGMVPASPLPEGTSASRETNEVLRRCSI